MRDAVARPAHIAPRHLRVLVCKFGVQLHDLGGGLADDDEAHDDGLLGAFVGKNLLAYPLNEAARIRSRLLYVIEIIGNAVLVHTGCASEGTC